MYAYNLSKFFDKKLEIPDFRIVLPKAEVSGKPGGQKTKAVLLGSGLSS